jgi:hypothetical protein
MSRDSTVGIATSYWLDDRGVGVPSPGGVKNFLFSTSFRPDVGSKPPIQCVPGTLSPGVKLPRHEADHSPPTSAEVKKTWSIHPLPYTPSWRSADFVKYRDNFTFMGFLIISEVFFFFGNSVAYSPLMFSCVTAWNRLPHWWMDDYVLSGEGNTFSGLFCSNYRNWSGSLWCCTLSKFVPNLFKLWRICWPFCGFDKNVQMPPYSFLTAGNMTVKMCAFNVQIEKKSM